MKWLPNSIFIFVSGFVLTWFYDWDLKMKGMIITFAAILLWTFIYFILIIIRHFWNNDKIEE